MKISVIIPVYNVKDYVKNCLLCVMNQSYADLEILVADDGSTDGSGEICDELAKEDGRIRVIHKANGGLSDARNVCIHRATGEFIAPIDSDDMIRQDYIKSLMEACESAGADVGICNCQKIQEKSTFCSLAGLEEEKTVKFSSNIEIKLIGRVYSPQECLEKIYHPNESGMSFTAWGKIYRRTLFTEHSIQYPVGKIHEDQFTTYKLIYYAKKVVFISDKLYLYRQRSGSIMKKEFDGRRLALGDATRGQCDFFLGKKEQHLADLAVNNHIRTLFSLMACLQERDSEEKNRGRNYHASKEKEEKEKELRATIQTDCEHYLPLVKLPFYKKVLFRIAARYPASFFTNRIRMF